MKHLRLALRYARLSAVDLAQFPFEVAMKVVEMGFTVLSLYAFWYSVTECGIIVPGWSKSEIIVMTGVGLLGGALTQLGFGFRDISTAIVNGNLDMYLIRPVHPLFTVLAERLFVFWVASQSISGAVLILMGARTGGLILTGWAPSILTLVLGCVTYESVYGCLSLSSLWFGRVTKPVAMLPGFVQRIAGCTPLPSIYYTPARILSDPSLSTWAVVEVVRVQIAWMVALVALSLVLWEASLRRYSPQGG